MYLSVFLGAKCDVAEGLVWFLDLHRVQLEPLQVLLNLLRYEKERGRNTGIFIS